MVGGGRLVECVSSVARRGRVEVGGPGKWLGGVWWGETDVVGVGV